MNDVAARYRHEWDATSYLREYYPSDVLADERLALAFQVATLRDLPPARLALEFGCGPTVHRALAAAPYVETIDMADYLPNNLRPVEQWIACDNGYYDWTAHVSYILECEDPSFPIDRAAIDKRESLTRRHIRRLLPCDVSQVDPLGPEFRGLYPLLYSFFCVEAATTETATWAEYMRNMLSLVAPGGTVILAALRKATWYRLGEREFPVAQVSEEDIAALLHSHFPPSDIRLEVRLLPEHEPQGYGGVIFASAVNRLPLPA